MTISWSHVTVEINEHGLGWTTAGMTEYATEKIVGGGFAHKHTSTSDDTTTTDYWNDAQGGIPIAASVVLFNPNNSQYHLELGFAGVPGQQIRVHSWSQEV